MVEDVAEHMVSTHFEVYLLWLFGWVMFLRSHDDSINKHYIWYVC